MAAPTNYITSQGDLNTIFAPINQVDYGILSMDTQNVDPIIYENWKAIDNITQLSSFNNIGIENDGRSFRVNRPGLYRLCINLNFGEANEEGQTVVFILSTNSNAPTGDVKTNYTFTPRPNLSEIYAINCSGASTSSVSGYFKNSLNNNNIGNCFGLNYYYEQPEVTSLDTSPYFFTFLTQKASNNVSNLRSNFYTLDVTFKTPEDVKTNQYKIFPYIRCMQTDNTSPWVTLQNSKWLFTKLSE